MGKMKFWRKMAKKQADGTRTGRAIRNYMAGTNHPGMLSPIHIWLFRAAGIPTPVYDAQQLARKEAAAKYAEKSASLQSLEDNVSVITSDVTDVEFTEGTV